MVRHRIQLSLYVISLVSLLFWLPSASFSAEDLSDNQSCMECHGEADVTGEIDGKEVSLFVDKDKYEGSIHSGLSCVDCHGDIAELPHNDELKKVDCASCHEDAAEAYKGSIHERSVHNGSPDAATCTSCHGKHDILALDDENSPLRHTELYNVCGKCHFDAALMGKYGISSAEQETLFKGSVHADQVRSGNENAPNCVNCHGSHTVKALADVDSPSNFRNVANTCGQCHKTETEQFQKSVHGVSAAKGHKDAPVCTDCHGEHAILRTSDDRSPVSTLNVSKNTCSRCHASIVINEKYGIESGKVENYNESYHGLATQHKSTRAANCGSCHGNHLILPASDPMSTVSPQRLVKTCGQCHPGIGENVLAAPIHADITLRSEAIAAWVPRIYILLIVGVIGGMLLHNGVIFWALMKEKFRREAKHTSYRRFTNFEIVLHVLLTVSFVTLVITGFALISPNSWWVTLLSYMQMTEAVRGLIHRIAAVTLVVISIVYAFYMVGTRRGRREVWAFMMWPSDFIKAWQHIMFYLGRRAEPPKFDRYDYTEKMEFWALVWGVIIMTVTGLILWFPILSFEYLPKWAIDMSELIHYYEAVLATLAIIVWHLFFVIFHPEEYPMSLTWINGRMTLDQLKHRHPLEYERVANESGENKGE